MKFALSCGTVDFNRNYAVPDGLVKVMQRNPSLRACLALLTAILAALPLASLARAQAPAVDAGGVVNAGSYSSGGVAPGSIVSIFGANLAGHLASATSIPLPAALGSVISVTFNSVPAPLYFVSSGQISDQCAGPVERAAGRRQ